MSTALLTDRYELTMLDAAIGSGTHERECVFEVFARRLPDTRRYGVVAGTGRLLSLIQDFRFGDAELGYLRETGVVRAAALDWLADFRFRGSISGYREGELYFPGSPILVVTGTFAEAVLLETLTLSVLNYDSAVASAAARMVSAASGRPLAEMGSRRTGERSAVAAARAAFIAGFVATSNLEAGRRWGVPTMGTAAHAFTLLHDNEEEAFQAQIDALGPGTTLLVDTFDIPTAVALAVKVAGPTLGAVRIDSGDLPSQVAAVRAQLDSLGATNTRITVTNDLDEYTIAALRAAPVDSFGVGTSVVTGSGEPASGMVYKLVAHRDATGEWISVAKKSAAKATVGGRKSPVRSLQNGVATAETIYVDGANGHGADGHGADGHSANGPNADLPDTDRPDADGAGARARIASTTAAQVVGESERDLLVPLVTLGTVDERYLGATGTALAREHHRVAISELPEYAFRLSKGEPVIPTVYR